MSYSIELCHLIIPNHKKEFYTLLEQKMPNWKKWKKSFRNGIEITNYYNKKIMKAFILIQSCRRLIPRTFLPKHTSTITSEKAVFSDWTDNAIAPAEVS